MRQDTATPYSIVGVFSMIQISCHTAHMPEGTGTRKLAEFTQVVLVLLKRFLRTMNVFQPLERPRAVNGRWAGSEVGTRWVGIDRIVG